MQEIDDFFDQLDSNIEVIWGISTDDSLGEDAKVTILATGLEDGLANERPKHIDDEAYYEDLIPQLYRPIKKSPPHTLPEGGGTECQAIPAHPLPSQSEEEQNVPEQSVRIDEEDDEDLLTEEVEKEPPTMVDKWKTWMKKKFDEYTQE